MLNIQPEKILHTGPGGWSYHAWNYDIKPNLVGSIDEHSATLGIIKKLDEDLMYDGDDVESFKEFIHVIVELSRTHGFTHIIDEEMDINTPRPIKEVILKTMNNWPEEAQKRINKDLSLNHLED